jgi:hypothetical protein
MKHFIVLSLALSSVLLVPFAEAHFKLLEPQSWLVENNLGDPQKLGPCGGTTPNPGMPSGMVNEAKGGSTLHIKLQETVFHPGHYRIALAVNSRDELPADPQAVTRDSEKGPWSVSAPIASSIAPPVLADGLWTHMAKLANPVLETDVQLPNINCPKCTLQITQFMAEHGLNKDGGFFYHHCADMKITADASKPIDTRWPGQR